MEAAYRESGLRPADIDLIECHATGTVIGDTTEIQSCAQIFRDRSRIALGSLKANLGHLLPVAGVAGLIKVLQSMEHGLRPAIPHLDELNPALAGTPLAPTLEPTEWPTSSVRRAAVNAFGFGGNNAHLLVEQAPATTGVSVSIAAPRPPADGQRSRRGRFLAHRRGRSERARGRSHARDSRSARRTGVSPAGSRADAGPAGRDA
jgi:acyl transferase domain-containing protein